MPQNKQTKIEPHILPQCFSFISNKDSLTKDKGPFQMYLKSQEKQRRDITENW